MIGVMLYCGNSGPPVAMITSQTQKPPPPVSMAYTHRTESRQYGSPQYSCSLKSDGNTVCVQYATQITR
jgi:hypothetical protein